jgi:hypothetical protein
LAEKQEHVGEYLTRGAGRYVAAVTIGGEITGALIELGPSRLGVGVFGADQQIVAAGGRAVEGQRGKLCGVDLQDLAGGLGNPV